VQSQQKEDVARRLAHDYMVQSKKWKDDEFKLEIVSERRDGMVVVDAVHVDDFRGRELLNKSVQLHMDVVKKVVITELRYQ
jgi:hypothetical protein